MKITAVSPAGFSWYAANPDEYEADGTYPGGMTGNLEAMGLGGIGVLMSKMAELMNGEGGKDMDAETLINALIQAMPDQAESIRLLVPAIMDYLTLQENTVDVE